MKRPWLFGLGVGMAFSILYLSGLLDLPDARPLDLRFDLRGPQRPTFPIVLVSADDCSLAEMNQQWPWPRSFHAKVIEQIATGNPLAIDVDILMLAQAVACARRVVLGSTLRTIATQSTGGIT